MATREDWASALWNFYFPESSQPKPVYLSMDDEDLSSIGIQLLGSNDIAEIKRDLVNVVLSDMQLDQPQRLVFARTVSAAKSWFSDNRGLKAGQVSPPPQLPLLAVTVMAAREIGGDATNSLAFYVNLRKLLGVREEFEDKLQSAYRFVIEELWARLNNVLIDLRWSRGIPTATAITHRYVSIPILQSIVRIHDRRKLIEFFLDSDLRPDSVASPAELQQLFDWWLGRGGHSISANLEALWRRGKVERDRVLDVISHELQAWDGAQAENFDGSTRSSQLRVFLIRDQDWFGNLTLSIGLAHQASPNFEGDYVSLESSTADELTVQATRIGSSNFFALNLPESLSGAKALFSEFEIASEQLGAVKKVAKLIYVLRFSPELQCFIEDGRPNLGETVLVLAASALGIAEKVGGVLSSHAAEGLTELSEDTHGFLGWRVFQDVKFIYPFNDTRELAPLSTNPNASLSFFGGLKLVEEPGFRVWSRHWLPTVDATIPEGSVLTVKIFSEGTEEPVLPVIEKTGFGRVQIDLRESPLPDGEYSIKLYVAGAMQEVTTKRLSIRSEASPRAWNPRPGEVLGYQPDSPAAPKWTTDNAWTSFPSYELEAVSEPPSLNLPARPSWALDIEVQTKPSQLDLPTMPSMENCNFTGAHHWALGTCMGQQKYVDAVCRQCNAQRREACKQYLVLKPEEAALRRSLPMSRPVPLDIVNTEQMSSTGNAQIMALHKSLRFLQQGTYKELKEAASSIGLDAIQTRRFVRWLEVSGSIEIENHYQEDASWSLNKPAIVSIPGAGARLVGAFGGETIQRLKEHISPSNISQSSGSLGIQVSLLNSENFEAIAEGTGLEYISDPLSLLTTWVRPISNLLENRQLAQLPDGAKFEKFNSESAVWEEVMQGRIGSAGSYRVLGPFSTSVFYVPEEGLARNSGYRLDTVTAKYVDCFLRGKPLVSYDATKLQLSVPLGMELPGLLGRLAVCGSGEPPLEVRRVIGTTKVTVTRYDNIDEATARVIVSCLGGK